MTQDFGDGAILSVKRPLRLWFAVALNVLVGGLSIALVLFLANSGRVPPSIQLSPSAAVLSSLGAAFLVSTSIAAILGSPRGAKLMRFAAFAFFGSIIAQNLMLLLGTNSTAVPTQKLVANVFRHSLSLAFNLWVLRSTVTQEFFAYRAKV